MAALRHGRRALARLIGRQCAAPGARQAGTEGSLEAALSQAVQQGVHAPRQAWPSSLDGQRRHFRAAGLAEKSVEVEVQSMGESISEGSIAEILKREGEAVAEDETIAQIETDKVTIDIRSPVAGMLAQLKVAVDDTVHVGDVVAVIAEGEAGEASSSSGAEAKPEPEQPGKAPTEEAQPPQQQQQQQQQASSTPETPHRTPAIRFPPRVTPDGRRISDLPAEERQRLQQEGQGAAAQQSKPAPPQQQPKRPQAPPKDEAEQRKSVPWYVGQEQGTKLSQSRVLSQREMEQIELGGAEP